MLKAIISRKKWSRGRQAVNALLVTKKTVKDADLPVIQASDLAGAPLPVPGTMCCLGFACLSVGATKKDIANKALPQDLSIDLPGLNDSDAACDFSNGASSINDDGGITDKKREKALINLAHKYGWVFEFIP